MTGIFVTIIGITIIILAGVFTAYIIYFISVFFLHLFCEHSLIGKRLFVIIDTLLVLITGIIIYQYHFFQTDLITALLFVATIILTVIEQIQDHFNDDVFY